MGPVIGVAVNDAESLTFFTHRTKHGPFREVDVTREGHEYDALGALVAMSEFEEDGSMADYWTTDTARGAQRLHCFKSLAMRGCCEDHLRPGVTACDTTESDAE